MSALTELPPDAALHLPPDTKITTITDWMQNFNERQLKLIENCRRYAHNRAKNLPEQPGHQLIMIIAKMAELLYQHSADHPH